jgi:hypothetical protein
MYYRDYTSISEAIVRKLPPLNALRTFESAARLASFTEAATELW